MRTFNRATVIGHVGNDVVMRHTQAGKPVVNLRVATNERRKDADDVTTWHRVVLWDRLAELAQKFVTKGEGIYLEGPLATREWTDEAGVTRFTTEMTAREMIFLGGEGKHRRETHDPTPRVAQPGRRSNTGEEMAEVVEEIPF